MNSSESKVVFSDGESIRVLRGVITREDEHFITLTRRDGVVRVAKSRILKIDQRAVQTESVPYAPV